MKKTSRWKKFLGLWLLMFLSYLLIKMGFNFIVFGWIDLRKVAFLELLIIPLSQSVALWLFYRSIRE